MMGESNDRSSSCTVANVDGTASVSCLDSTSSGYQVILLHINGLYYNLTVMNVTSGENRSVPVVPSGRYCIMELPMGEYNDSQVKYFREFTTEFTTEETTGISSQPSKVDDIGIASKLVSSLSVCIEVNKGEYMLS